jgi:hypothetical protein
VGEEGADSQRHADRFYLPIIAQLRSVEGANDRTRTLKQGISLLEIERAWRKIGRHTTLESTGPHDISPLSLCAHTVARQ